MPVYKLQDIARVQIGLVLSRKETDGPSGYTYQRLLLKALQEDGIINLHTTEPYLTSEPMDKSILTRAGTIVIKLSSPLNPVLITHETEGMVIPSQMAAIDVQAGILPEYIRFYLSQEFVGEQLLANYSGIAQRSITISSLQNLEIEVPTQKNQQLICDCYENFREKRRLRKELDQQEQKIMQYIFTSLKKDKRRAAI